MLLIQNKGIDWDHHTIGIPGHTTRDRENGRIPFNPEGRLVEILERRRPLGPNAYAFGSEGGEYQPKIQTGWDAMRLLAYGSEPHRSRRRENAEWNRLQLRTIDLHWYDLRRLTPPRRRRGHPHHPADARARQPAADAAVSERDG
jgi:hypothetical protein